MTKREALKLIRQMLRLYEAGYSNDTLAGVLQIKLRTIEGEPKGKK